MDWREVRDARRADVRASLESMDKEHLIWIVLFAQEQEAGVMAENEKLRARIRYLETLLHAYMPKVA